MKIVTVLNNQTLIDITMQELGDVERLFELAVLNGVSITGDLQAGSTIVVPDFDLSKRNTVRIFSDKSLAPASEDDGDTNDIMLPPGGIGFMRIIDPAVEATNIDFIVS